MFSSGVSRKNRLVPYFSAFLVLTALFSCASPPQTSGGARYLNTEKGLNYLQTDETSFRFPAAWTIKRMPALSGAGLLIRSSDGKAIRGDYIFRHSSTRDALEKMKTAFFASTGKIPGIQRRTEKLNGETAEFASAETGGTTLISVFLPEKTNAHLFSFTVQKEGKPEEVYRMIRNFHTTSGDLSERRRGRRIFLAPAGDWRWLEDSDSGGFSLGGTFNDKKWYASWDVPEPDDRASAESPEPRPKAPALRLGFPGIPLHCIAERESGSYRILTYVSAPSGQTFVFAVPSGERFGDGPPEDDPIQRLLRYYLWMEAVK